MPARRSRRSGGSRSDCHRHRCPSRGAASTWRWRPPSWPPRKWCRGGPWTGSSPPGDAGPTARAGGGGAVARLVLLGELGLDGTVRAIRGVLPAVLAAARAGHRQVVVPETNADEAGLVEGIEVLAAATLGAVVAHLTGTQPLAPHQRSPRAPLPPGPDLADVVGQAAGRRAVEVAAAGGHHL